MHCGISFWRMPAMGQTRHIRDARAVSVSLPAPDVLLSRNKPRSGPFSNSCTATIVPIACMIGDLALSCQIASSQEN